MAVGLAARSYPHWANPQLPEYLKGEPLGPFSVLSPAHATPEEIGRRYRYAREHVRREHQDEIEQALRTERLRGKLGLFVALLTAMVSGVLWLVLRRSLRVKNPNSV